MIRKLKLSTCALLPAIFAGGLVAQPVDWNEIPLADGIWSENSSAFHEATFEIPVPAQSWLEFKLAMEEGDTVVYEWHAAGGEVGLLSTEFHGHTEPVDGKGD